MAGDVKITMDGGIVNGAIYGGSNEKENIRGNTLIRIRGGTIGTTNELLDRVFGGGKGRDTGVTGNTRILINDKKSNVMIYGNAFGGSESGEACDGGTGTSDHP